MEIISKRIVILCLLHVLPHSAEDNGIVKGFMVKLETWRKVVEEQSSVIAEYNATVEALNKTMEQQTAKLGKLEQDVQSMNKSK